MGCWRSAALLTGANADCLTVLHVAYRIGLGIFEGDEGNHQVAACLGREVLVCRGDVGEECIVVEVDLVASLLEGDAIDHLALDRSRTIGGVHLNDTIGALALGLQDLECLGFVARGDDTIADLAVDQTGGSNVAHIGEGDEVAERRHAVGTTSPHIGRSQRRQFVVIGEVDLLQRFGERQAHGGTGR